MTYVIALPCVDVKDKACIDECPVEAIYYEDDLTGMLAFDHPIIAALAPQGEHA